MNEDIKQYKISVPLIDIEELTTIDNYYNEIVNEYLEKCLKEKEEIIVQRIMMNLRKENQQLKEKLDCDLKWSFKCDELTKESKQLKEQLQQKEDIINKAKNWIDNHDIDDSWELLEILDNKGSDE